MSQSDSAARTPAEELVEEFHKIADRAEAMSADAADLLYEAASLRYEVWMEADRG